ncbi:hypothetical protein A3A66_01780 [Microgenomates group bacterium RIFCSPLOWO2_01_FULL_46_13]|nr:MAG: hypothetical protein A3A66_01780 [Microgenomates group bacterium RIFCSPLOWO2_01_FULL_46_13]
MKSIINDLSLADYGLIYLAAKERKDIDPRWNGIYLAFESLLKDKGINPNDINEKWLEKNK